MTPTLPAHTRTSRLFRIQELMVRYGTCQQGKSFRIRDPETGDLLPPEFDTEDMARAGARGAAACDIAALFDGDAK